MATLVFEHFGRKSVGDLKVMRVARSAYPTEWSEAIVEEHGAHDVLHVGRIAETPIGQHDVCSCTAGLEEEGVAVVEEVHAAGRKPIDGSHLSTQRSLDTLLEAGGIVGHHALAFFESVSHGIVASCPRVVERSLVGTEVHLDILVGKTFPKVDDIADIGH